MSESETGPSRPRLSFEGPYKYQPTIRTLRRTRSFDDYLKDIGQDNSHLVTFDEVEASAVAEVMRRQNANKKKGPWYIRLRIRLDH